VSTPQLTLSSVARLHGPWGRDVSLAPPGRLNRPQQGLFVALVLCLLATPLLGALTGRSGVEVTPTSAVALTQTRLVSAESPLADPSTEAALAAAVEYATREAAFGAWYASLDLDAKAKVHYLFLSEEGRAEWDAVMAPPPPPAPAPPQQVAVSTGAGTSGAAAGTAPGVADGSVWDALAACESGGNWAMNSGNGFYGGIQFMHATWVSVGGRDFAEYPHQASRSEQIAVAERLLARSGWGQWPACSSRLGLR
jgi:hypothetical protein